EDLTQEVFVRACRSIGTFENRSSPGTWLYTIAVRVWHVRQEERAREKEFHPPPPPENGITAQLERIAFEQAIAVLPQPLREAWILVKAQGLKYREAAEVLGAPEGTIKARVHQATLRLRSSLAEDEPPNERCRRTRAPAERPEAGR